MTREEFLADRARVLNCSPVYLDETYEIEPCTMCGKPPDPSCPGWRLAGVKRTAPVLAGES